MSQSKPGTFTRRDFARRAALLSAAVGVVPVEALATPARDQEPALPENFPKLSPEGKIEAESRYQGILKEFGTRFSEEEKNNLHLLAYYVQPSLERLRAYTPTNGDAPALYLKPLMERSAKTSAPAQAKPAPGKS